MSNTDEIIILFFVILGALGLVITVLQYFPVVGTLILFGIVVLVIYARLSHKQGNVTDRRQSIIEDAEEFDARIQKLADGAIDRSWAQRAREIDSPGLLPRSRSQAENKVDELDSEIQQRQQAMDRISTLEVRIEAFEKSVNESVLDFPKDKVIDHITHFDSDKFDLGIISVDLYSLQLDTKALVEIDSHSDLLDDIEIEILDAEIQDLRYETIENDILENYFKPLVLAAAQLVTIRDEKPIIDTKVAASGLNQAIQKGYLGEQVKNPVEPLFEVLKSSMKIESMLIDVNLEYTNLDEKECLQELIQSLKSVDVERISNLEGRISEIAVGKWEKKDLFSNSWRDFEKLIADLWSDKGYSTKVTPSSADQGFDVRAEGKVGKRDLIIEAKQYSSGNTVGRPVVQKTLGTLSTDRASKAVIVTTSSFSKPAHTEARKASNRIELINGDDLLRELNKSNLAPPSRKKGASKTKKYEPTLDPKERLYHLATKERILDASEATNITNISDEKASRDSPSAPFKETRKTAELGREYNAHEVDHPFDNIVNPEQPVKRILSVARCPKCGNENSIWRTKNVNTGTRYECSICDRVWRRKSEIQSEMDSKKERFPKQTDQLAGQDDDVENRVTADSSPSSEILYKLGDELIAMANNDDTRHDIEKLLEKMDVDPSELGLTESDLAEIAGKSEMRESQLTGDEAGVRSDSGPGGSTSDENVTGLGERDTINFDRTINNGLTKDGQYVSIEIVGIDFISIDNPLYAGMQQLEGLIVALYIANKSDFDWDCSPDVDFSLQDSDGFSLTPKQEVLVMIEPSGGWKSYPVSSLAPNSKMKLFLYFDYCPEGPFELMYRTEVLSAAFDLSAGPNDYETLSFELDAGEMPTLPMEIWEAING